MQSFQPLVFSVYKIIYAFLIVASAWVFIHHAYIIYVLILVYDFYNGFSLGFILSHQPLCAAFCSLFSFLLCCPYCDAKQVSSISLLKCLFVCLFACLFKY